jgi:hypothetical protein
MLARHALVGQSPCARVGAPPRSWWRWSRGALELTAQADNPPARPSPTLPRGQRDVSRRRKPTSTGRGGNDWETNATFVAGGARGWSLAAVTSRCQFDDPECARRQNRLLPGRPGAGARSSLQAPRCQAIPTRPERLAGPEGHRGRAAATMAVARAHGRARTNRAGRGHGRRTASPPSRSSFGPTRRPCPQRRARAPGSSSSSPASRGGPSSSG